MLTLIQQRTTRNSTVIARKHACGAWQVIAINPFGVERLARIHTRSNDEAAIRGAAMSFAARFGYRYVANVEAVAS